jgi:hypothetical protein
MFFIDWIVINFEKIFPDSMPYFVDSKKTLFNVSGLQFLLIAASLGAPLFSYTNHPLLHYLWATTGATTFLSAVSYAFMKESKIHV